MKKILALLGVLLPACAVAQQDAIKMVTFFPAPHVAYEQLPPVDGAIIRVGLADNDNRMDLGSDGSAVSLRVGVPGNPARLFLGSVLDTSLGRRQVNFNKNPNSAYQFMEVTNGINLDMGPVGTPGVTFEKDLHIGGVAGNPNPTIKSLVANDAEVGSFFLFNKQFPSCASASSNDADKGKIRWGKFTKKGDTQNRTYLVCGDLPCPNCWKWHEINFYPHQYEELGCMSAYPMCTVSEGHSCDEADQIIHCQICDEAGVNNGVQMYQIEEFDFKCERDTACFDALSEECKTANGGGGGGGGNGKYKWVFEPTGEVDCECACNMTMYGGPGQTLGKPWCEHTLDPQHPELVASSECGDSAPYYTDTEPSNPCNANTVGQAVTVGRVVHDYEDWDSGKGGFVGIGTQICGLVIYPGGTWTCTEFN